MVSKAKYTILDIVSNLKVVILPSRDKYLKRHNFFTLKMFQTAV